MTCLNCKNLQFEKSKILQDCFHSNMELYCKKHRWSFDCEMNSKKELIAMLETANNCKELINE